MPFQATEIRKALLHLRKNDPVMKGLIRLVGPFTLKTQSDRFHMLVRSIIAQQISVGAARSIMKKLEDRLLPDKISPASMSALDAAELRSLGVSLQKAGYLIDLSQRVAAGQVELNRLGRLGDEEVIEQLTLIKGIGRWTAQMFLIFSLGRLDILPHADLGVQAAIRLEYQLRKNPRPKKIDQLAKHWRPYCSIASWYLWQSLAIRRAQ